MQFAEALELSDLLGIVDPDNPDLNSELADVLRLQMGIRALIEYSEKYTARRAAKKTKPVPQMTLLFDY